MKPLAPWPAGFTGEFESEISLPVHVLFAVDAEGAVELAHVRFCDATFLEGRATLLWNRLPPSERRALLLEAQAHAERTRED